MKKSRRHLIKGMGALGLGALFRPALAMGHGSGMPGMAKAPEPGTGKIYPAAKIPWQEGRCAFCGMPLATPEGGWRGKKFPKGFFERTYAQIVFEDGEALHFESLACMFNYAYAKGLVDGDGSTFYVMAVEALPKGCKRLGLMPARQATYVWGEKLKTTMMARLVAVPSPQKAGDFVRNRPGLGRYHFYTYRQLLDLSPLPEANLVPLLAKHTGLV